MGEADRRQDEARLIFPHPTDELTLHRKSRVIFLFIFKEVKDEGNVCPVFNQ
jgi:hypothetical protein